MSYPYTLGKLTRRRTDGSTYWHFCIVWWEGSDRRRHSLGTANRVAAEAIARRIWATIGPGRSYDTIGDIVAAYLDSLLGTRQEARKREAWVAAGPYWAGLKPASVDAAVSAGYLTWRKRAANTMRHELSLIRTACNWAVDEGHLDKSPPIKLPAIPETSVGHLTKGQFRALLAGCGSPHIKLFAMLAVTTGGRKSALLEAKWDQVDLDRAIMDLNPVGRRQNSKFRATVPLNDMILPALGVAKQAALTDYLIEYNGAHCEDIKKGFAAAARRSGIPCHPHMLRHSAAVWMAEDRVPMAEIASYLGHRDINVTTRVYAKFRPDYLRHAAESLAW